MKFCQTVRVVAFASLEFILAFGPHIGAFGDTPLMVQDPHPGWRQLISGADELMIAQLSEFKRPRDADMPKGPRHDDNAGAD